jgi:branched-chain amino acid transport system permease protein
MALGFALIYNTTRIFHVAHGAIYTAAAYITWLLVTQAGLSVWGAVVAGVSSAAVIGALVEVLVYAPLVRRAAPPLVALLSSLGLYVAAVNIVALLFGNETKILRPGVEPTYKLGWVVLTQIQVAELAVATAVFPMAFVLFKATEWGKVIRAVRDDPVLAQVMGVDLGAVRIGVFAMGSALAGLSGVLTALDVGMDPQVGMPALLTAAVALIVGGVGTFGGPVLGGFLLGLLQALVVWKVSARWSDAVIFGVLILFLLFRPTGILARRRRLEEAWE